MPVTVAIRETTREGKALFLVRTIEFSPVFASVSVSRDGDVLDSVNVGAVGLAEQELVGRDLLALAEKSAPSGSGEHVFVPRKSEPILTWLTVTRGEAETTLRFEVIDHKYELVLLLNADGTVRDCSRYSARQLTGHSREELVGKSINFVVPFFFPVMPERQQIACQALHKVGHPFQAMVTMFKTDCGMWSCHLRRNVVEFPQDRRTVTMVELPDVQLGALLGTGSFGHVRLGLVSGEVVAVKFIGTRHASMARSELEIHRRLHHENIPGLFDFWDTPTHLAIAMEFCSGVELGQYLVRGAFLIPVHESRHYFRQLTSAIGYVHSVGILHRDITLQNVIVNARGNSIRWRENHIKLIDFGLSCSFQPGVKLTNYCGSTAYASPELLANKPYHGEPADIWAMGVCLYAMLAGRFPFRSVQEISMTAIDTEAIADGAAANLVTTMLSKPVCTRATMAQILSHAWMREDEEDMDLFAESANKRRGSESTTEDNGTKRACI